MPQYQNGLVAPKRFCRFHLCSPAQFPETLCNWYQVSLFPTRTDLLDLANDHMTAFDTPDAFALGEE
ncbi:hypothetical protein [Serratia sp. UGAL515B_01]|uniref:hypothetical protein n=1 Tax=Serratia sp. UGAL515B_01 TaxID=2986763 RepID=UPI002954CBFC|nr:hypothetical protein [Serratia sp. UGAL515B_01]WON75849.1 hypothetical protein OK023_11245 [Serratia sp. UGAL515B_01]